MIEHINDKNVERFELDGELHRPNGPAITWKNLKESAWYLYGKGHRYYGPRISSTLSWHIHGKYIK